VAVPRRREQATSEYGAMGDRLRAARQARGLSLRALAERLNVSPSLISQVETGRANPSVSTLYAIVQALGISLDELLFTDAWAISAAARQVSGNGPTHGSPPEQPGSPTDVRLPDEPVQRAGSRSVIRLASGVTWERLTTASIPNVDFLHVTYDVGGASSPDDQFQRHSGQEWGFILSGRLGVRVGFEEHFLGPGDAIAFDSATPHRLFNAGTEPVHGIWFVLGRRSVELGFSSARPHKNRPRTPVHSH
jgi:DNA-binding XRE family transcriptional regulator/mannose-6-phosphate isomerase-like protein (cupin superfamily)